MIPLLLIGPFVPLFVALVWGNGLTALFGPGACTAFAIAFPSTILLCLVSIVRANRLPSTVLKAELRRILALRGETPDELTELIEFYSKVGELEKADEYAKKLVEIS